MHGDAGQLTNHDRGILYSSPEGGRGELTGAVDELSLGWIVLLVCDNERQQRHGLAGARWHFQHAIATRIKGLCSLLLDDNRSMKGDTAWQREHDHTFEITHVTSL